MSVVSLSRELGHQQLVYIPPTTVTTNGDSGNTPLVIIIGQTVVFFINVTAVSGTSPTLNLYVDIQDPASLNWANQYAFPQITAVGLYYQPLQVQSTKYRVRWVVGGTSPSFTFSVGVVIIK